MDRIRNFRRDKSGATAVEYGLIVALIAIACAVAIGPMGVNLASVFAKVNLSAPSAPSAPSGPADPAPPRDLRK
jgi:pilus assembly protein Flp/PilA